MRRGRGVHLFLAVYGHGTGCRRGEAPGLKWSKVDWENMQICIDIYSHEAQFYWD